MTKSIRRAGWMAAVAASALWAAPAGAAPKYTLKFATLAPEGSAWMQRFEQMKKEVLEATGGAVQLKAYPGGVLGDEKEVLFKMKVGQVDGGGFMGSGTGQICPDARTLMMPMIFRDYDEVDAVFGKMQPLLEQACLENGYVALGWAEIGFSYVYSTKPVHGFSDLRQAKAWSVAADPVLTELFKVAKVDTIIVPVSDVLTALQTGLIQTVYAPPLACVAMQWFTKIKYWTDQRVVYSYGGVFVTRKSWEKIPAELREKVSAICHRAMKDLTAQVRKSNEESFKVMADNGIQPVHSSPADIAEFEAVGREATKNLRGTVFSAAAYDEMEKDLIEYRARHPAPAGAK